MQVRYVVGIRREMPAYCVPRCVDICILSPTLFNLYTEELYTAVEALRGDMGWSSFRERLVKATQV